MRAYRYFLRGAVGGEELCVKVLSFPLHTGAPLTWGLHLGPKTHHGHVTYTRVMQTWLHTVASNNATSLTTVTSNDSSSWSRVCCKTEKILIMYPRLLPQLQTESRLHFSHHKKQNFLCQSHICLHVFCIRVRACVKWKVPLVLSSSEEAAQWHTPSAPAWWTPPSAAPKGYSGKDTNPPVSHKDAIVSTAEVKMTNSRVKMMLKSLSHQ